MHDAVIQGSKLIGVAVNKEALYRACAPRKCKDTALYELQPHVPGIQFIDQMSEFAQAKGGAEYYLINKTDCKIRLVTSTVLGRYKEQHTFIHSSGALPDMQSPHHGAIIDNRTTSPIFLLDDHDSSSIDNGRKAINDFFRASTRITGVWEMRVS